MESLCISISGTIKIHGIHFFNINCCFKRFFPSSRINFPDSDTGPSFPSYYSATSPHLITRNHGIMESRINAVVVPLRIIHKRRSHPPPPIVLNPVGILGSNSIRRRAVNRSKCPSQPKPPSPPLAASCSSCRTNPTSPTAR